MSVGNFSHEHKKLFLTGPEIYVGRELFLMRIKSCV